MIEWKGDTNPGLEADCATFGIDAKGPMPYRLHRLTYNCRILMRFQYVRGPDEWCKEWPRFSGIPIQRALVDVACNQQIALTPSLCEAMEMLSDW